MRHFHLPAESATQPKVTLFVRLYRRALVASVSVSAFTATAMQSSATHARGAAKAKPCTAAEFRQFDFWIGDWAVLVNDRPAGHNVVTLEQDGCLLVEHWTANAGGQTGSSFNYYDINDKKWHQLYLSNSGNAGAFPPMAGNLVDEKMVMLTEATKSPLTRWTWYVIEPGKVKQMAESSTDGGATWRTTWNSVYVKQ